ncbi:hypothetical protein HC891_12400 [Candidatus Gracilibacteria bacterium]|nr:hypothetical protein [Candidatus Gracilibacteria bacterium]
MHTNETVHDLTRTNLTELHHYWRLLAAFTNEVDMALRQDERTPEQRLAKIGELVVFARSHMASRVPPSVVADDMANPACREREDAIAAAMIEDEERRQAGKPTYHYKLNAQGQMEGPFLDDPTAAPFTEEEEAIMRREGWRMRKGIIEWSTRASEQYNQLPPPLAAECTHARGTASR